MMEGAEISSGRAYPGALRALGILARLRLRRSYNLLTVGMLAMLGRGSKTAKRQATPAKRTVGWMLGLFLIVIMGFTYSVMSRDAILHLHCDLNPTHVCGLAGPGKFSNNETRAVALDFMSTAMSTPVAGGLALELALLCVTAILLMLGARGAAQQEWDFEWLATMPLRRRTLLWGRVIERAVPTGLGFFLLVPFCIALAWSAGLRWSAPPVGVLLGMILLACVAPFVALFDTGLRMALPPARMRNTQAVIALFGMPLMLLAMTPATSVPLRLIFDLAHAVPAWIVWTPPGLAVRLATAPAFGEALPLAALLLAQTALLMT
ncbi:MAG TPA: hypothetical protein VIT92_01265, partial [Burkholderiaceae bacterium]